MISGLQHLDQNMTDPTVCGKRDSLWWHARYGRCPCLAQSERVRSGEVWCGQSFITTWLDMNSDT